MAELKVVTGDATVPIGSGNKLIVHVCNDVGAWGAGFVLAVSKKWPEPQHAYRIWFRGRVKNNFGLGAVQFVQVANGLWVANMIAQTLCDKDGPPIEYDSLNQCLQQVAKEAKRLQASVHMPRIGCGLAGGTWEEVGPIVQETLVDRGIEVTVYDFDNCRERTKFEEV
jgi:O-acetyl-ADP-ribose deacetylase (regulator of RNase III)